MHDPTDNDPSAALTTGARLDLVRESGGLRHYLSGEPVHAGDGLELQLEGGSWVGGRYEWNFQGESPPLFYFGLAGVPEELVIALPSTARLRRPKKRGLGLFG